MTYPEHEPQPTTVTGRVKTLLNDLALARELRAGYNDQAAIERDLERMVTAEKTAAQGAWAEMRADGVPVAEPNPEPEPERAADVQADAAEPEPEIS
jgi:hypothetical protein